MGESAHMTAAELLDLVADVIAYSPLHLLRGTTHDGGLGEADHETTTITISPAADRGERNCALVACLLHLQHGARGDRDTDEQRVREEVARLLVPRQELPAILDTADPTEVAHRLHVDLPTARLGIALARAQEAHPTEDR